MTSVFNTLNAVNVNEYVEKKGRLSYVSWSYAWQEVKKRFPESFFTIYESREGWNYHTDGKTCWVKTGATVVWYENNDHIAGEPFEGSIRKELEHIEFLPIMDYKNQSIPADCVTSMDANKAIQRSLTKAIARHGIGLYIYAGEDLPEESREDQEEATEVNRLRTEIDTIVREQVKDMSAPDKKAFFTDHVVPYIQMSNYYNCKDANRLTLLAHHMRKLAG